MTRKQKAERKKLRKQVEWCRGIALDYYIAGNYEKEAYWEAEARKTHQKVMQMYPRFRDHEKIERKRVYVAVMPELPARTF